MDVCGEAWFYACLMIYHHQYPAQEWTIKVRCGVDAAIITAENQASPWWSADSQWPGSDLFHTLDSNTGPAVDDRIFPGVCLLSFLGHFHGWVVRICLSMGSPQFKSWLSQVSDLKKQRGITRQWLLCQCQMSAIMVDVTVSTATGLGCDSIPWMGEIESLVFRVNGWNWQIRFACMVQCFCCLHAKQPKKQRNAVVLLTTL